LGRFYIATSAVAGYRGCRIGQVRQSDGLALWLRRENAPPIDFPEGGTPAQRLDRAFRKVLTVPKGAILKAEELERIEREKKRAKKKH
jgi:hypothetical protein